MTPAAVKTRLESMAAPRILLVRNDGLGDLILTLPVAASIKAQLPRARVSLLAASPLAGLVRLAPQVDGVVEDPGVLLKRHRGNHSPQEQARLLAGLEDRLTAEKFDLALFAYAEAASAALVWRAGVAVRSGPLRRTFFWRFNTWQKTSRKNSPWPEYRLNLESLTSLGLAPEYHHPVLVLPPFLEPGSPYVVLHPYKRNTTALSWPLHNFVALADHFLSLGLAVVAVGDGQDRPVLDSAFGQKPGVRVETGLDWPGLAGLIGRAKLFVGNSSGPLHLAGWSGTPHVGFFPQNRVSAPSRWQTLPHPLPASGGPNTHGLQPPAPGQYLLAPDFPKRCVTCEMDRCPHFNCVASIPVERAVAACRAWGIG